MPPLPAVLTPACLPTCLPTYLQDPAFTTSCYCCGSTQHLGEQCPYEARPHLAAERAGDARKAQALRQQELEAAQRWGGGGGYGYGNGNRCGWEGREER